MLRLLYPCSRAIQGYGRTKVSLCRQDPLQAFNASSEIEGPCGSEVIISLQHFVTGDSPATSPLLEEAFSSYEAYPTLFL